MVLRHFAAKPLNFGRVVRNIFLNLAQNLYKFHGFGFSKN